MILPAADLGEHICYCLVSFITLIMDLIRTADNALYEPVAGF